jgi:hypothetical protein
VRFFNSDFLQLISENRKLKPAKILHYRGGEKETKSDKVNPIPSKLFSCGRSSISSLRRNARSAMEIRSSQVILKVLFTRFGGIKKMKKLLVLAMVVLLSVSLVWASATNKDAKQTVAKNATTAGKIAPSLVKQAHQQAVRSESAKGIKGQGAEVQSTDEPLPGQDATPTIMSRQEAIPQASGTNGVATTQAPAYDPIGYDPKLAAQKQDESNQTTVDKLLQEQNPELFNSQAPEEIKGAVSPNSDLMLQVLQDEANNPKDDYPVITSSRLLYQTFDTAGWSLTNQGPLLGWSIIDSGTEGQQVLTYDKWHKFYYTAAGWGDTVAADMWKNIYTDSVISNLMETPTFDLTTALSCSLYFKQYFLKQTGTLAAGDTARVRVSIDNGATWTNVATYTTTSASNPTYTGIPLNAYIGNSQVKVAFWHFIGYCGSSPVSTNGWVIDSVTVNTDTGNLFVQDFSNVMSGWNMDTPPSGPGGAWTIINNGVGIVKATNSNDWNRRANNLCGDTVAACTRNGGARGEFENEWLISPMFSIASAAQCTLSLNEDWNFDSSGTYWPPPTAGVLDHGYIRIQQTTDGGTSWGPWQLVFDHNGVLAGSSNSCPAYLGKYSLTPWKGTTSRISFNKVMPPEANFGTWYLANVRVQQWVQDIAVTAFIKPDVGILRTGVPAPMQVYYKNVGDTALTFDAVMVVNDSLADVYTTTLAGQTLNSGDSLLVDFGTYTPLVGRRHTFTATANVTTPGGDGNLANNTLSTFRTTYVHYATGGPDLGMYKWKDSYAAGGPAYGWVDVSGGTAITFTGGNDDGYSGAIALPSPFFYYGSNYSNIYASTNGFLSFTALTSYYAANTALPNSALPNNTLAAFWDDLVVSGSVKYLNDAGNNRFVVQYDSVYSYGASSSRIYFQILLNYADSTVVYQYKRVTSNAQTDISVGTENSGGTAGLSYFQDGVVPAGLGNMPWDNLAIKFYWAPLTDDIAATAIVSPFGLLDMGGSYIVSGRCANVGVGEQIFDATMTITNAGSPVYTNTVTGIDLLPGTNTLVTFPNFVPAALGLDSVFLTVNNPGDQNNANDSKIGTATVNSHDGVGGPDGGNYSWIDNTQPSGPTFGMLDMTGATPAVFSNYDDGYLAVPIGHSFFFYGNNFTNVTIGTNGYLTFDVLSSSPGYTDPIPSTNVPNNLIDFMRADLNNRAGSVTYLTDLVNNRFVVNYDSVIFYGTAYYQDVQVILNWGDSTVTMQYANVSGGGPTHFTIGTENATGLTGLQYYYSATTLGGLGNYPYSGMAIKYYYTAPAADVGITSVDLPLPGFVFGGTPYTLAATAQNFTGNPATFNVEFYVDAVLIGTNVGVNLPGGGNVQVTCPNQWTPSSSGSHIILAKTVMAGDLTPANDASQITRVSLGGPITDGYTNDFETNNGDFVVGAGTDWAWGVPTYVSGPTAHSGTQLWGTNLAGQYTAGMLNTLYSPVINLTGTTLPTFKFWFWYALESGYDGANVKLSTDYGTTWNVITTSVAYNGTGYAYAPGIAGQPVWTGNSNAWLEATIGLSAYVGQSVILRFDQSSDPSICYAGLYLDDASIYEATPAGDVGVSAILGPGSAPTSLIVAGQNRLVYSRVHNYGNVLEANVPVSYEIKDRIGNVVYSDNRTLTIAPGADSVVYFNNWIAVADTHFVKSWTSLPGDANILNDTTSSYRYIYPHRGTGGPTGFWSYADNFTGGGPAYSWVEIDPTNGGPGTNLVYSDPDDGNSGFVPMGMNWEFFGTTYSQINVNVNGWLSFTDNSSLAYSNTTIPNVALPNTGVYLDWTDGHLYTAGTISSYYDAVNNDFIIEYDSTSYYGYSAYPHSMEVIFHGNTHSMTMQYKGFSLIVTNATVGIENQDGTVALAYDNMEPGQTPYSGYCVTWTYLVPPTPIASVFPTSFDEGIPVGNIANRSFTLSNVGMPSAPALVWSAGSSEMWIQNIAPVSGSLPGGTNVPVAFDINTNGLLPGTDYNGTIVITSNDPASPLNLPVHLFTSVTRQVGLARSGDFVDIGVSNYGILGSYDDQNYTYNWHARGVFDYEGSFILGNSGSTMMIEYGIGTGTHGFGPVADLNLADLYHPTTVFNDSGLYGGVTVGYNGFGFTGTGQQDIFIHQYIVTNNSAAPVNGLYAGNYFDWDVGSIDSITFDRANNVVIQGTTAGPFFGIAVVSGPANTLMGVPNDTIIYPQQGWIGDTLYHYIGQNANVLGHTYQDMSSLASFGPFDLGVAQVETVAFAIIGGSSRANVSARAALARQIYLDMYNAHIVVTPPTISHSQNADQTVEYPNDFQIRNVGTAPLTYSAQTDLAWVTLHGGDGYVGHADTDDLEVDINSHGIAPGPYTATVTINSNDPTTPVVHAPVISITVESNGCVYMPGDINGNGSINAVDIVYAVNYFKGSGNPPPIDCGSPVGPCPEASPFYAEGDVNGNCAFNAIDITFFVRYLKLEVPSLLFCTDCAPASMPAVMPSLPHTSVKPVNEQ